VAASTCALDLGCHALRNEPSEKLFEDNNREGHCESTAGSAEEGNTQTPMAATNPRRGGKMLKPAAQGCHADVFRRTDGRTIGRWPRGRP
jgi:hypothetical protein